MTKMESSTASVLQDLLMRKVTVFSVALAFTRKELVTRLATLVTRTL
jgi:hypothetical protein